MNRLRGAEEEPDQVWNRGLPNCRQRWAYFKTRSVSEVMGTCATYMFFLPRLRFGFCSPPIDSATVGGLGRFEMSPMSTVAIE